MCLSRKHRSQNQSWVSKPRGTFCSGYTGHIKIFPPIINERRQLISELKLVVGPRKLLCTWLRNLASIPLILCTFDTKSVPGFGTDEGHESPCVCGCRMCVYVCISMECVCPWCIFMDLDLRCTSVSISLCCSSPLSEICLATVLCRRTVSCTLGLQAIWYSYPAVMRCWESNLLRR